MTDFEVQRSHLKSACDTRNWDLLDKLLDIDNSGINDNSLYTDGWGEWWGMLLECVKNRQLTGTKVLLKHGADPDLESWGDGIPLSPREAAARLPKIRAVIENLELAQYKRKTNPPLPDPGFSEIDRQGNLKRHTGFFFPTDDQMKGRK